MKEVTFVVEITTKINDNVDPDDVCFDIDCGCIPPRSISTGNNVGHTTCATTTNFFEYSEGI